MSLLLIQVSRNSRLALGVFFVLLLCPPAEAKRKDDIVIMKNGDRFTGEIQRLEQGRLRFKSSYMESAVQLNWEEVAEIHSRDSFILSLRDGTRLTGRLQTISETRGSAGMRVIEGDSSTPVKPSDLIRLEQQERRFWSQLRGSIDFGFSFASDETSSAYSFSTTVSRTTYLNAFNFGVMSNLDRTGDQGTARHNISTSYERMLDQKWFFGALADFLHSEQQELQLRSTFGGGIGRKLFQTDRTSFAVLGGGVYTHENYSANATSDPERSNVEGHVAARFTTFRFRTTVVTAAAKFFPSISDPGRVRLGLDGSVKFELLKDVYWRFTVYDDFDSRPPLNVPNNDVGVTTSLGWSF